MNAATIVFWGLEKDEMLSHCLDHISGFLRSENRQVKVHSIGYQQDGTSIGLEREGDRRLRVSKEA